MPQIDLSTDDATLLRTVLESAASDLRYEIHNTDSQDYREKLRKKQDLLTRLIEQLDQG